MDDDDEDGCLEQDEEDEESASYDEEELDGMGFAKDEEPSIQDNNNKLKRSNSLKGNAPNKVVPNNINNSVKVALQQKPVMQSN